MSDYTTREATPLEAEVLVLRWRIAELERERDEARAALADRDRRIAERVREACANTRGDGSADNLRRNIRALDLSALLAEKEADRG